MIDVWPRSRGGAACSQGSRVRERVRQIPYTRLSVSPHAIRIAREPLSRARVPSPMALGDIALAMGLAFWFLLPAYVANPMAVVFGGGVPMDFGRVLRDGRRVLGDGKTWRGVAGGAPAGVALAAILRILGSACGA